MQNQPELSPDLRPIRYCPHCGERVAQRAETCFMCGASLIPSRRRRIAVPIGDLLLVAAVLAIAFLWWTRSANKPGEQDGSGASASGLASTPGAAVPIWPPIEAVAPPPAVRATAIITASAVATATEAVDTTPTATPTPVVYTVISGDTVEKIAAAFGISRSDLMAANNMSSDLIRVDQKLLIPTGPVELGPDGKPVPTATPTPKSAVYLAVVQAGDTIQAIAARFGTSVDAIVNANDRLQNADTIIRPGEQLIVPVGTVTGTLTLAQATPPTATPVPTPTPTPGPRWPAPLPLSPRPEQVFDGGDVLLQWLSVGTLAANEVYIVTVVPDSSTRGELLQVTTSTSFRAPESWLVRFAAQTSRFLWSVRVARDVQTVGGQAATFVATSPSSPLRAFVWNGGLLD
jgi:LysM repeat protein